MYKAHRQIKGENVKRSPNQVTMLAIDSATTGCSVCIWRDGKVLGAAAKVMARGQAQELMPMVDQALASAKVEPTDINVVAVTRGPGAFTGLRIGLATARGFALALDVPCVGVTTLEAVAAAVKDADDRAVLVCVESKREDMYVQLFTNDLAPVTEPLACNADALKALFEAGARVMLAGDAAERALEMLSSADIDATLSTADPLPDAAVVAEIAAPRVHDVVGSPEPLYLRPPDAKLPKAQGRMRV